MCGVSQKRMRSIRARRTDLCPAGALFWEGGRPTCTVSLVATVRKLANALALIEQAGQAHWKAARGAAWGDEGGPTGTVLLGATVQKLANANILIEQ